MVVPSMNLMLGPRRKAGDTIVEVLIAMAIVTLTLTSAYALTRRNASAGLKTQEQSAALKLVEKQTELLLAANSAPTTTGCFDENDLYVTPASMPSPQCAMNFRGSQYNDATESSAKYNLSVTRAVNGTYTVNSRWTTPSGATANVSVYVRRAD